MLGAVKTPKRRQGARGVPKVKSGCRTCKIRHKKCDEAKPACSQCTSTSRRCDFLTPSYRHPSEPSPLVFVIESFPTRHSPASPVGRSTAGEQLPSMQLGLADHMRRLKHTEIAPFDYFRFICAQEFSLYFQSPIWEQFVLFAAQTEAWAFHAALAISALTRRSYTPAHKDTVWHPEFTTLNYNKAIQLLNQRLDMFNESAELAILGSVLFINIEFLQRAHPPEYDLDERNTSDFIDIHLKGGLAIIKHLEDTRRGHLSQNCQHLKVALDEVQRQAECLKTYQPQ